MTAQVKILDSLGAAVTTANPLPVEGVVSGSVAVSNLPATQPISGAVAVSNFPATQPVSGTVTANAGSGTLAVSGPLTDTQLRASAVPVFGPLTDAQIRATALPVSGPATDAQMRASALPVMPRANDLAVTAVGAAAAAVTLTLPAVAGQFHYIDAIEITCYASAAGTGGATPVTVTSTNLSGGNAWTFPSARAIGSIVQQVLTPNRPVKSAAIGTATTIVCPATAGVIWRVNAYYCSGA